MIEHKHIKNKATSQVTAPTFYNIGYNSKGKHRVNINGKKAHSYRIWRAMLARCYDPKTQEKAPTYKGCTVHPVWHDYQNFAEWYLSHEYHGTGYQLDKDILKRGNKVYSPDNCTLVPHAINSLFNDHSEARGDHPQGVTLLPSGRFRVQISMNGKRLHCGVFDCPNKAHSHYIELKEAYIKEVANKWKGNIDDRVYTALMEWKAIR